MSQGEAAAYIIFTLFQKKIVTLNSILVFLREMEDTENPLMGQITIYMLHGWIKQEAERVTSVPPKEDEDEEDRPICYWQHEVPPVVLQHRFFYVSDESVLPFNPMFLWFTMSIQYDYLQQDINDNDGAGGGEENEGDEQDEQEEEDEIRLEQLQVVQDEE